MFAQMVRKFVGAVETGELRAACSRSLTEFGTDQHRVGAALHQTGDHLPMLGSRLRAELLHVTEQREPAVRLHGGEIVERGMHRRRIGVVGVDYQGVALRAHHLRAYVVRGEGGDGRGGFPAGHSEIIADRNGREHVVGVVGSDELRGDHLSVKPDAQEGLLGRTLEQSGMLVVPAVAEEMAGQSCGHALQVGVVFIDEYHRTTAAAEPFVEFPFGSLDPLE